MLQAASFIPKSIKSPNAWVGHLPFAAWIIRETKPNIFVELGTHSGNSYFSFCQSVAESGISTRCYAVDTWQGDAHAGKYNDDIFNKVNAHNDEQYAGFSQLLRMTFDEALSHFSEKSIDLLHIDGLHTYEAVRQDFEAWLPKLTHDAIVLFHDTTVKDCDFGVWKFWEELKISYPNNLEFIHSNGLGVLQLNGGSSSRKLEWLHSNEPEKQMLINYFSSLGMLYMERFDLKNQINFMEHLVSDRDNKIVALNAEISRVKSSISWRLTKPIRLVANLPRLIGKRYTSLNE